MPTALQGLTQTVERASALRFALLYKATPVRTQFRDQAPTVARAGFLASLIGSVRSVIMPLTVKRVYTWVHAAPTRVDERLRTALVLTGVTKATLLATLRLTQRAIGTELTTVFPAAEIVCDPRVKGQMSVPLPKPPMTTTIRLMIRGLGRVQKSGFLTQVRSRIRMTNRLQGLSNLPATSGKQLVAGTARGLDRFIGYRSKIEILRQRYVYLGGTGFNPRYSSSVLGAPIAYWRFDEGTGITAGDASGNGNTATLAGGSSWTLGVTGVTGDGVLLDGVTGQLSVTNAGSLNPALAFSLAAWVYPTSAMTDHRAIFYKSGAYYLYASIAVWDSCGAGAGGLLAGVGSPSKEVCTGPPLPTNTWTHLAATSDGTTFRLFRNGVLVKSGSSVGVVPSSTAPLLIGASKYGEHFPGRIDEARIYDRALSAADIQALVSTGGVTGSRAATVAVGTAGGRYPQLPVFDDPSLD